MRSTYRASDLVVLIWSVGDQTSAGDEEAIGIDCRQPILRGQTRLDRGER